MKNGMNCLIEINLVILASKHQSCSNIPSIGPFVLIAFPTTGDVLVFVLKPFLGAFALTPKKSDRKIFCSVISGPKCGSTAILSLVRKQGLKRSTQ